VGFWCWPGKNVKKQPENRYNQGQRPKAAAYERPSGPTGPQMDDGDQAATFKNHDDDGYQYFHTGQQTLRAKDPKCGRADSKDISLD
jgi:hypothetical protein